MREHVKYELGFDSSGNKVELLVPRRMRKDEWELFSAWLAIVLKVLEKGASRHPEDRCEECGGDNISWFTDMYTWNGVVDRREEILCPVCFVKRAEVKGIGKHTWSVLYGDPSAAAQATLRSKDA